MFEFFEHTADLGFRIQSPSKEQLFEEAAQALFAAICSNPELILPSVQLTLTLHESSTELLLRDWLALLLTTFESDKIIFSSFIVTFDGDQLNAIVMGEPFQPKKHGRNHEVKAITYHQLVYQENESGFLAEIIVDI